jgi:hypothetical protein
MVPELANNIVRNNRNLDQLFQDEATTIKNEEDIAKMPLGNGIISHRFSSRLQFTVELQKVISTGIYLYITTYITTAIQQLLPKVRYL